MIEALPRPTPPTSHPDYKSQGHPRINVFSVKPVTKLHGIKVGDTVNINAATYVDPLSEMDYHHSVASRPRWVQGLLLRIEALESVYVQRPQLIRTGVLPADKVFVGEVVNHDNQIPVRGVLHPDRDGWMAFDESAFGDIILDSIADLKGVMGKLSADEVRNHNSTLQQIGTFTLSNGLVCS